MKKGIVILSLFMLFKPILPVLEYMVLYDYIKNELCVNKDKPELRCNGKCHLKEEMDKASDSENGKDKYLFSSAENHIIFCYEILSSIMLIFSGQYIKKTLCFHNIIYHFSFSDIIFKPPILN